MTGLPPILQVHNRYRQTGGEEAVVADEHALLRGGGHDVHLRQWDNADISGPGGRLTAFARAAENPDAAAWIARELDRTGAGIVHVHNFFPRLSPAIHREAARRGVAVVQTLHNYRLTCAAGTFLRDGEICEKCPRGGRQWAVVHRCYRSSVAGSIAAVRMQRASISQPAWCASVHRFIALTRFARDKLVEAGLPAQRTVVKGNFLPPDDVTRGTGPRDGGVLFAGRLSVEKGVEHLVRAFRDLPGITLTICGTGPMEQGLRAMATPNVRFTGQVDPSQLAGLMRSAALLAMPSLWYEGFPRTMVEAFARELPVIASDLGSMAEIAGHGRFARLVPPGDPAALSAAIGALMNCEQDRDALARDAHARYRECHMPAQNLAALETIYRAALEEAEAA